MATKETSETCPAAGKDEGGNILRWISEEITICSSFIGCEMINDEHVGTAAKETNDTSSIADNVEPTESSPSIQGDDANIMERESTSILQSFCCAQSCFGDSNTVAAVAPALHREGSYEFDKSDSDIFVKGKTFVFVHTDFHD